MPTYVIIMLCPSAPIFSNVLLQERGWFSSWLPDIPPVALVPLSLANKELYIELTRAGTQWERARVELCALPSGVATSGVQLSCTDYLREWLILV